MQFEFLFKPFRRPPAGEFLALGERQIPLVLIKNPRAKRYLLRLRADGSARVTVPRGGTLKEGRAFAERNLPWLGGQLQKVVARNLPPKTWSIDTEILLRGELVILQVLEGQSGRIQLGGERFKVVDLTTNLRPAIEKQLWKLALKEFPSVVMALALQHDVPVRRVSVRNQRSRWGSCSQRGTVSLNWRLIHAPIFVRDYVILHELMHLRQMNHSARFWREVDRVCPAYAEAERWLKQNAALLR